MSIKRKYTTTLVLGDEFLADTGNEYRVVAQRPYKGKKGLSDGVVLTLQILHDKNKYPEGEDDMRLQTFDAYILCGSHDAGLKKGDYCALEKFMPDVSYHIDFSYILRFGGVRKVAKPGGTTNADQKQ